MGFHQIPFRYGLSPNVSNISNISNDGDGEGNGKGDDEGDGEGDGDVIRFAESL
jgi:hypothetical protein